MGWGSRRERELRGWAVGVGVWVWERRIKGVGGGGGGGGLGDKIVFRLSFGSHLKQSPVVCVKGSHLK